MRQIFRIAVAAIVLVTFSLGATDFGLLLSAGSKPGAQSDGCPLHMAKCCCPKVCKAEMKAKPSCHNSAAPKAELSTAKSPSGAGCVLKAGCGTKKAPMGWVSLLKDFVPESLEKVAFDQTRSVLIGTTDRLLLLDSSPQFFHPPRIS